MHNSILLEISSISCYNIAIKRCSLLDHLEFVAEVKKLGLERSPSMTPLCFAWGLSQIGQLNLYRSFLVVRVNYLFLGVLFSPENT